MTSVVVSTLGWRNVLLCRYVSFTVESEGVSRLRSFVKVCASERVGVSLGKMSTFLIPGQNGFQCADRSPVRHEWTGLSGVFG